MLNEVKSQGWEHGRSQGEQKSLISFCSFATVRARSDFLPSASQVSY